MGITGNQSFPSIWKNKSFNDVMNSLGKTTIILNNIDTNPPTEIGVFIHYFVRHDTIELSKYLKSFLPYKCPPLQQDIITIWAGNITTRRGWGF
jgi:hypothetical protein